MATPYCKSKSTNNSNCCLMCRCQTFALKSMIKYADLDEQEKVACAKLMTYTSELGTFHHCDNGSILCVPCYRSLHNGSEDCGDMQPKDIDVRMIPSASVAGNSLAITPLISLLQDGYRVNCGIEVENLTEFSLVRPCVQLSGGTVSLPPCSIAPATREAMVARKHAGLAEGTYGTASWLILPMERRLVIMWSAPFNFDFYSNWLAVGLTGLGITEHSSEDAWFQQMYKRSSNAELKFERREYSASVFPIVCSDDDFEVEGTMGTDHNAAIKVILRPRDPNCLAPSIKKKMSAT